MADVIYPTSTELTEIAQDLMPRLEAARPTFSFFPRVTQDSWLLSWEQMDNFIGLQYARGLNGEPTRIKKTGARRYTMQPGVYGEFEHIDEEELTIRRQYGSLTAPVDITDLVSVANSKLLQRELDRQEATIWTLLTTGTFSVQGPTGAVVHTDIFTLSTMTPTVPWSTTATATPLADLRALALMGRGRSVNFASPAEVWVNQVTANNLIANTNANDLGGKRLGLGTINNLNDINTLLTADGLARITVYEGGYYDESNTWQLFIPNGKAVALGARPAGQVVGQYRLVRNVNNDGFAPGSYSKVVDSGTDDAPPRKIDIHRGHNGGPVLFYGTAIVQMNV
jgi:hypothetical protein